MHKASRGNTMSALDALDALDAVPEAQHTEWYKRLEETADFAAEATEYANCEIESVSP